MSGTDLSRLRVLIVEDESLVTMLIEDMLEDIGCAVAGAAAGIEDAMRKMAVADFNFVILDVNLNGQRTYRLAGELAENGVPFIFATGYGAAGIPEMFQQIPVLQKPFDRTDLERCMLAAMR